MTTEAQTLPSTTRYPGFNRRRAAIALAIALGVLLTLIAFIACSNAGPTATHIVPGASGVSVAGLDRSEVEAMLRESLPDVGSGRLTIQIGSLEQTITYADVERDYDLTAILDQSIASGSVPVELAPAITYNADELARQVDAIVAQAQALPVNATINYESGEYVLTPASDGRTVDGAAVLQQATAVIAAGDPADATIVVNAQVIPADIGTPAAQAAIALAQSVTSTPLTLNVGTDTFTVDTATLHSWVQLEETAPGQWTLAVDDATVDQYIAQLKTQVDQPPVEATFEFNAAGEPVATAGHVGQVVDADASKQMIVAALNGRGQGSVTNSLTLPVVATDPEFTTAEAQGLVSRVRILGAWTTNYIPNSFNGFGTNIRRPAELIDGTVVQPGGLFSFVGIAGPITTENGYTEGAAIIHGHIKADGVLGGGLCSASTTMFNAALRAGFQMGARFNHAYYISRYPIGLDATIWISGASVKNMTFTNDSPYPIVIRSINKRRSVTFQVWGVPDGRTVTLTDPIVTNEVAAAAYYEFTNALPPRETLSTDDYLVDGFDAVVVRTVRNADGQIIHQDTFNSSYNKVDVVVLVGRYPSDPPAGTQIPYGDLPPPPGPTPSPTPGGTPGPSPSPGGPVAHFSWGPKDGSSLDINFTDTSTGSPTSWSWASSDGWTSTVQSPTHTFAAAGIEYTVTLTVSNANGTDNVTKTITIPPPPPPPPTPTPTPTPPTPPTP